MKNPAGFSWEKNRNFHLLILRKLLSEISEKYKDRELFPEMEEKFLIQNSIFLF